MTDRVESGGPGAPSRFAGVGTTPPFCGDDYPPLKGSPGAMICTKPCHGKTEMHMNEETGWAWWEE